MNYIKIAWRNLWRNKRRTVITTSSILFAVFFVVIMRSFQLGSYGLMINNTIESYMGFLQIQNEDYLDDKTIDNSFEGNAQFMANIKKIPEVKAVVPRLESFALASTGNQTKGVIVLGVDPEKEKNLSNPQGKLVLYRITPETVKNLNGKGLPADIIRNINLLVGNSYISKSSLQDDLKLSEDETNKYLTVIASNFKFPGSTWKKGDDGILVSDRLAKFLEALPGDTLILMGQGYHGLTAAGIYPVRGIIKIPAPDLDNKVIYMPLNKAQELFSMPDRLTSISINLYNNSDKDLKKVKGLLMSQLQGENLVVKSWKEFNKVLFQQIQSDNQSGQVMLGLLYFIVLFGMFGTVLMMIHERRREFAIMISIGMKRMKLAIITIFEMLIMGMLGVISGIALSFPIIYIGYRFPIHFTGGMAQVMEEFGFEPIMPMAWINTYVLWQGVIVVLMVLFSCLFPLRKVFKLKEVDALKA